MAGEQPKENADLATPTGGPGAFPGTPANELDKPIGIAPLPAADGAINPITLAPGEKVPETITAQSTTSHVKLDKESYEKSDALGGVDTTLPPISSTTIPESSLPMGGNQSVTINSVGPSSTTAALAGNVPLEPKVPAVVKESQGKAGVDPEASAVAAEVEDKAQVEDELKSKVPEAPSTSEGTAGVGTEKSENSTGGILAAVTAAGGAAIAAVYGAKDTVVEKSAPAVDQATISATDAANQNLPDSVKEKLPVSAQEALAAHNKETTREEVSPEVPAEVKQSITDAGKSPEAAGNTVAVEDKKIVEAELLKEVKTVPADGEAKGDKVKPDDVKPADVKPADVKPVVVTPADVKPVDVKSEAKPLTPANGAGTKSTEPAASSSTTPTETTADKKKKNRLSTVFSKIKHKLSDKN